MSDAKSMENKVSKNNQMAESLYSSQNIELSSLLKLVSLALKAPWVAVSSVDEHAEKFIATVGFTLQEVPVTVSFGNKIIHHQEIQEYRFSEHETFFIEHPFYQSRPELNYYVGCVLLGYDGTPIGILSLMDTRERFLNSQEKQLVSAFSLEVVRRMEMGQKILKSKSGIKRLLEKQFTRLSYYHSAIINATEYAVMFTNTDGTIKTFNSGASTMLGYSELEVVENFSPLIFHEPEELQKRKLVLEKESGYPLNSEFQILVSKASAGHTDTNDWTYLRKNGSKLNVQVSVTAVENEQHITIGYLAIAEDITERKITQAALQLSEEKHRLFFENSQSLMSTHDAQGTFLSINTSGAALIGYTPKELIGLSLYDITPLNQKKNIDSYLNNIQQNGEASGLMKIIHKNGNVKVWLFQNVLINENKGSYVIANAVDVSSRIELEKNLKKAKSLAIKNAHAKDHFLANMSHEIRTPMNAIIGFTDVLLKSDLNTEQLDFLTSIKMAGENLLGIINDILDFSKIESGNLSFEKSPFSLKNALKSVYEMFKMKTKEKGLNFNMHLDPSLPETVIGDQLRLNQILFNLISNAIKFTQIGEIQLSAKCVEVTDKSYLLLFSIKDTGIGIADSKLESIFERFSQASNDTNRKYGGTGLGLSISKNLAEMQKGSLTVTSNEGVGSEFILQMPFEKTLGYEKGLTTNLESNELGLKPLKILLVEDNELNQKLAIKVVSDFGYDIHVTANGKEGIEKVKLVNYDLILMDLQMPVMDGYEATTYIRNTLQLNIPIIAMTAHTLNDERDKCLHLGMNDYIAKPFKPADLLSKIIKAVKANQNQVIEKKGIAPFKSLITEIQLQSLKELSGGNEDFEKEMISIAIKTFSEEAEILTLALSQKKIKTIRDSAHKLKSNLAFFGLYDLKNAFEKIETTELADTHFSSILPSIILNLKEVISQLQKIQSDGS